MKRTILLIALLLCTASFLFAKVETYTGVITEVDVKSRKITTQGYKFSIGNNTAITVDGEKASLEDLKPGMKVSIIRKASNPGTAESVDATAGKDKEGGGKKKK